MAQNPVTKPVQAGFTLIEVMIALVLTALAIMGIIALFITETKASGFSRHTTEAAVLAQDKVEKLRTSPSPTPTGTVLGPLSNVNVNESGLAGGIYTRTWTETATTADYADISVTVTWNDDGIGHTIIVKARRNRP